MALLSEEEKQQLKQIMADYPNNEDLDLTAYMADVIGITGKHVEEGWYNQDINDTILLFTILRIPTRTIATIRTKQKNTIYR